MKYMLPAGDWAVDMHVPFFGGRVGFGVSGVMLKIEFNEISRCTRKIPQARVAFIILIFYFQQRSIHKIVRGLPVWLVSPYHVISSASGLGCIRLKVNPTPKAIISLGPHTQPRMDSTRTMR